MMGEIAATTPAVPGQPFLPCRSAAAVPIGEPVGYWVPLVGTSTRNRIATSTSLLLPVAVGTL